ncbi:MAG: biotin--[acetyl-CoA-carboxylase] ligase [Nitrospiraceae bacterium]|nr:biotin--[acetyl-CoA-carboxylase] ligase [Nitrospiraceae bacterium]
MTNREDILTLLRSSRTGYVSGAELAGALGVSRTAVWKHIRALAGDGYEIEAVPSKGYRLRSAPDLIRAADLRKALTGALFGAAVDYHRSLLSTNTRAMNLAQEGAPEGTVVLAEVQTGGKGRLGRTWASPPGNIHLSVVLRPPLPLHRAALVTLASAVAAATAIREATGLTAGIKWPNDILIQGRKVAGILTEMSAEADRIRHLVLGIGVNVNADLSGLPAEVQDRSITLAAAAGRTLDRTDVLIILLRLMEGWYHRFQISPAEVIQAWKSLNATLGRRIAVNGPGGTKQGIAEDITEEGLLVLRDDSGRVHTVASGDVTIEKT